MSGMSGGGGLNVPLEDERELLAVGTQAVASGTTKQPILGSYLPVNPVQRYTFKKWAPDDWNRHNESKKFQSNRDREGQCNSVGAPELRWQKAHGFSPRGAL